MKSKIYYKRVKIFKSSLNVKGKEDNKLQSMNHLKSSQIMMKYLSNKVEGITSIYSKTMHQ
jgi:hypothetical protein